VSENVEITINGIKAVVDENMTVLEAATSMGIEVPRLCFLKGINENASCRLCVVEIEGLRTLKNSCTVKVKNNMNIKTNTQRVKNAVKFNLELIAGNHKFECWKCPREHNCELLRLLRKYNIENKIGENADYSKKTILTNLTDSIELDSSKCILCGRCVATCEKLTGASILDFNNRGFQTYVGPAMNHNMSDTGCIYCGKCIQACPVGAIKEKDEIDKVIDILENDDYYKVVQMAPAVRAALGEEFGYDVGTNVEGKMYQALKILGFDDITDVNFAADVTIIEEGTELIDRIKNKGVLPLFTSCSPGWIRYIETYYPEFLPNLSSCKSPQQIQGSLTKHYYGDKIGVRKDKIKVISIMPCIAKKSEANRPEMEFDGVRDVDVVLTTRELARLIKRRDIDFRKLDDHKPNSPLAKYTGAGVIFGASGGVMEAALRSVANILEGKDLESLDIIETRGTDDGIKEVTLKIAGEEVNVAIVHGGVNIPLMLDKIKNGDKKYTFIEFMACSGGCVNGGGQPILPANVQETMDVRKERAKALYNIDVSSEKRQSHENEEVQKIYKEFLEKPGSHKAHKFLHTHYHKKEKYSKV
jgi:NADP-reducing hydrogenase subunit HndD